MSIYREESHDNDLAKSKKDISGSRKREFSVSNIDERNEKDSLPPVGRQYKKTKIAISDETTRTTTISIDSGKIDDLNRYEIEEKFPLTSFLLSNEELPKLPILTDPGLLDDFWDNCWDPPQKKSEPKKKDHWRELETIGDAYLNLQIHRILVKICGEENFGLIKVLKEHAKGNPFLMQLGKHYKLDEWVRIRPCFYPKQWADLMEAWIGAVIKERMLYDVNDPLEDLNIFLRELLIIRYRKLEEYFLDDINFCRPGEEMEWRSENTRTVEVPGDSLMTRTVHLNGTPRVIGYQVMGILSLVRNQADFIASHGFGSTVEKAEAMAVQNAIKIKQDHNHNQWITECDVDFLHHSDPLFRKYQQTIFGEIKRIKEQLQSPLKRITIMMNDKYDSWVKELKQEETEDYAKTVAMLKLHQAIIELEGDKCPKSYELLGSVLEYGVKRIDRAWDLTYRTIQLFHRIGERLECQLKIQTQKDLRQGEISARNFPTYRWTKRSFKYVTENPAR